MTRRGTWIRMLPAALLVGAIGDPSPSAAVASMSVAVPTLTGVTPAQCPNVFVFYPNINLQGTDLDTVTSVAVGGVPGYIFAKSATALSFSPPAGQPLGPTQITVTSAAGTSNALPFAFVPNHPSILIAPGIHYANTTQTYHVWTEPGWNVVLFASLSRVPSVTPGLVQLNIGNQFTQLFPLGLGQADPNGQAQIDVPVPGLGGLLVTIEWQAVTFPDHPVAPLEASNSTTIWYF